MTVRVLASRAWLLLLRLCAGRAWRRLLLLLCLVSLSRRTTTVITNSCNESACTTRPFRRGTTPARTQPWQASVVAAICGTSGQTQCVLASCGKHGPVAGAGPSAPAAPTVSYCSQYRQSPRYVSATVRHHPHGRAGGHRLAWLFAAKWLVPLVANPKF